MSVRERDTEIVLRAHCTPDQDDPDGAHVRIGGYQEGYVPRSDLDATMTIPMAITVSLIFSPIWPRVQEYLHIVECAQDGGVDEPRIRIEFLGVPEPLMRELVRFEMPCVKCERPNHPLRRREGDAWDMGRLYYAPACPIAVRPACSRGRAAELEYERFKGLSSLLASRPVAQLELF